MDEDLSPRLTRGLAAIRELRGRTKGGGRMHAVLGDIEAVLAAGGAWGAMIRETGAPNEALTAEERALLYALESGRC